MPPKTAQQLIEDEVKEYRKELLRDVTEHSELKADDLDSDEIDAVIQEEKMKWSLKLLPTALS